MRISSFAVSGLLVALGVWLAVSLSCALWNAQTVQDARVLADEQIAQLDERIASIQELHDEAVARGDEEAAGRAEAEMEVAEKVQSNIENALARIDSLFNEDGTLRQPEQVVDALSPWLPAGAGTIVGVILGVLRGIGKTKEADNAFASLVKALEAEKQDSNGLSEAMHASGTSLRSRLSTDAKLRIDAIRGR
jgi:hypothetical protein